MADDGFQISIDTSGLERHFQQYIDNIRSKLANDWPQIANEALADIASRAPFIEEEYQEVMGGSGVPLEGNASGDQDYPLKQRIRFIRAPGKWIIEAIYDPRVNQIDASSLTMHLGNAVMLDALTHYSWANYKGQLHESSGGTWVNFEFGLGHQITPAFGTNYKLSPDPSTYVSSMVKKYPMYGMYTHFDKAIVINAIKMRINEVKF